MIKIQNKKTVAMTLVVVVVLLAVTGFLVVPAMRDIKQLNREILARRIELERLYVQGQSIRQVTEDLEETTPELSRVEASLPRTGEELKLITTLEGIASRNHLGSHLEFAPQKDIPSVFQLTPSAFEVKLVGSFSGIYQYLWELDQLPYYIFVQSLTIEGEVGRERPIQWGGTGSAPASASQGGGSGAPFGNESTRAVSAALRGYMYWKR